MIFFSGSGRHHRTSGENTGIEALPPGPAGANQADDPRAGGGGIDGMRNYPRLKWVG